MLAMRTSVCSSVSDIKYGGVFIRSLHLLCSPAVLAISVGASVIASASIIVLVKFPYGGYIYIYIYTHRNFAIVEFTC